MTEPTKLQLMTTEQLINELLDRFEHVVIVGRKTDDDCRELDCDIVEEWQGDYEVLKGLCSRAIHHIQRDEDDVEDAYYSEEEDGEVL